MISKYLLRCLLSTLLLLAPIAVHASGLPCCAPDGVPAATGVPCHGPAAAPDGDVAAPACEHCEAATPQCQCVQLAVAATLPSPGIDGQAPPGARHVYVGMLTDALPDGPGERLFRPPIR